MPDSILDLGSGFDAWLREELRKRNVTEADFSKRIVDELGGEERYTQLIIDQINTFSNSSASTYASLLGEPGTPVKMGPCALTVPFNRNCIGRTVMHPDDPRTGWEDVVAAELRERWAFDERTLSEMLMAAASGIESSESTLHETVKLDAFGKGKSTAARHAISCNLGKTFEAAAAFAMTAGSALTAAPWVGMLGLLLFIKRLSRLAMG